MHPDGSHVDGLSYILRVDGFSRNLGTLPPGEMVSPRPLLRRRALADAQARMHQLVLGPRHDRVGAERFSIELDRFFTPSVEEQIWLDLHRGGHRHAPFLYGALRNLRAIRSIG